MIRLSQISFILLSCLALFLSACDTGGGYSGPLWDFNQPQPPAQEAPGALPGPTQPQTAEQNTAPKKPNLPAVKVGLLLPLSGPHAQLAQAMLNAAQIALFDIGHDSFQLIPVDSKGTRQGGKDAATDALNQGAELILGPIFANAVRGAKPVASRANINIIAFSTDWQVAGGNTYLMGFMPFDQIDRVVGYAASKNIRRIGVLAASDNYGRIVSQAYQAATTRYGLPPAMIEYYDPRSGNLSPIIQKFTRHEERKAQAEASASGAYAPLPYDAVFMSAGGDTALSIANLLSYHDMPPGSVRRLGTGLFDDKKLARERGLDGAWFAAPSPGPRETFEHRYTETYSANAPRLASLAYDATALAAVLAQRGLIENGRPAFDRRAISNPNGFSGIDGIFRFRANGTAERGLAILEYQRGQIIVKEDAPKTFQALDQF